MLGPHLTHSCWGCRLFNSRSHLKGLQTWLPVDAAFKQVFGPVQEIFPCHKPTIKKQAALNPCASLCYFSCSLGILLLWWHFSWLWKTTLSSNIFSAWENATLLASFAPLQLAVSPRLSQSTCTEIARFEEKGKPFGISSHLSSPVFWC